MENLSQRLVDKSIEAFPEYSSAVINVNWKNIDEIPFIIGHELGHLMLGHKRKEFDESPTKRILMERAANEYSLYLLTEYCIYMRFTFMINTPLPNLLEFPKTATTY